MNCLLETTCMYYMRDRFDRRDENLSTANVRKIIWIDIKSQVRSSACISAHCKGSIYSFRGKPRSSHAASLKLNARQFCEQVTKALGLELDNYNYNYVDGVWLPYKYPSPNSPDCAVND